VIDYAQPSTQGRRGVSRAAAPPRRRARAPWLRRGFVVLAVFGVLVPIAASRLAFAALPLGTDQGLYVTIAQMIHRGAVPWRDAFELKPPGTYYLYAAVLSEAPDYAQQCIFRGRPFPANDGLQVSCAQLRLSAFDALYAFATAAAVGYVGWTLFGSGAGLLAAVLFAVFGSMYEIVRLGGLPDQHALLPVALAYAATLRFERARRGRWLVLAGALAAVGALFKQTAGLDLIAICAWLTIRGVVELGAHAGLRRAVRLCGQVLAGAVAVFGVTAAIFARLGVLGDLIDQSLLFNVLYVVAPVERDNFIKSALAQSLHVFTASQGGLWLAALGGLLLLPSAIRRDPRLGLLLAWTVAACASIALGNARFSQYYYIVVVPPLSILGAWGLSTLWQRSRWLGRAWLTAAAAAFLVFSGQSQAQILQDAWYQRITSTRWTPDENVAGALREAKGELYIFGNASQVYAISGRPPASRYLHSLAISDDFLHNGRAPTYRADLIRQLEAQQTRWIAFDTPWLQAQRSADFPELRQLVSRDYELANDPKNPAQGGWEVYRRRDDLATR
jgi:hypothetical protein